MTLLYACEAAATAEDVEANCSCDLDALPWPIQDLIDSATDMLFLLSGGLVSGRCTTTVRPCATGYECACGNWTCMCCQINGIILPGYDPVVSEVLIDGDVVPSTDYVVANGNILAKRDGTSWPAWQNPLAADTEDDTFAVTYVFGMPYDFTAKMATVELVCEMAKSVTDGTGRLPKGTVSASADGVQIVVGRLPGQEEIQAVGLTWLGRFMAIYGTTSSPEVRSPELDGNWVLNTVPA